MTPNIEQLVKELRQRSVQHRNWHALFDSKQCNEAANTIEQLAKKNAQLEATIKSLKETGELGTHIGYGSAVTSTIEKLQSRVAELEKDKERLKREHHYFVAAVQGGLLGLSTHPTETPLNGCLISKASMDKLNSLYSDVLKERTAIDSAIASEK
jgi:DNA repair exonuclease SbcCD ATPase subunit